MTTAQRPWRKIEEKGDHLLFHKRTYIGKVIEEDEAGIEEISPVGSFNQKRLVLAEEIAVAFGNHYF